MFRNLLSRLSDPPVRARDITLEKADGLNPETAFGLAYGRSPTGAEKERMSTMLLGDSPSDLKQLRNVIQIFDRQSHPTSISIRFDQHDLTTTTHDGFSLVVDKSDLAVSRGIIDANYEPHVVAFIREYVKEGMTAIDIGGNVGFHSMLLSSIVGENGRVMIFEPNTENCRLILLSLDLNEFKQTQLYPLALSDTEGYVFFAPMIGSNGGLMPSTRETLLNPNCTVVPCSRLDSLVQQQVDFIKIDVEGAEYLALSGGKAILERYRPVIVSEFSCEMIERVSKIHGQDFIRWLISFGYRPFVLSRESRSMQEIADVDNFFSHWGSHVRIEDIAFLPGERTS